MSVRILNLCMTFTHSKTATVALDGVSLCAFDGEILCVLGHNGAGKSTLLNILAGAHPPTKGSVSILGQPLTAAARSLSMGVCPQEDELYGGLTGRENIRLFASIKGIAHARSEVERVLAAVKLTDVADRLVNTYSGGMKRRLSMAGALLGWPRVLLLDEPSAGMDVYHRKFVWDLVLKARETSVVVLTTHSLEEAEVLGDKIAILDGGRLTAVGTPDQLKSRCAPLFHIDMHCTPEHMDDIKELLPKMLPKVKLTSENSSGALSFTLPESDGDKLIAFVRYIDTVSKLRPAATADGAPQPPIVLDWAIRRTTLEEVFLKMMGGGRNTGTSTSVGSGRYGAVGGVSLTGGYADSSGGGGGGKGGAGDRFDQTLLSVRVSGRSEPVGVLSVNSMTTLSECRVLISREVADAPKTFSFLLNNAPVPTQQENLVRAVSGAPLLVLRSHDAGIEPGMSREDIDAVVERFKRENEELAAELRRLRVQAESAQKQKQTQANTQESEGVDEGGGWFFW